MEDKTINFEKTIDLFRKVISALSCIEKLASQQDIKEVANKYAKNLIEQYDKYYLHHNPNKIEFKYSEKEIVDFSNDCYDQLNIFVHAEDLEHGFDELIEKIIEGRKLNNE